MKTRPTGGIRSVGSERGMIIVAATAARTQWNCPSNRQLRLDQPDKTRKNLTIPTAV